jgi:2-polyprenylphenol 6-hydroxylase
VSASYDLIIVGAGMVGASAALAFARKGYRVAVLERENLDAITMPAGADIDLRVSAISPASQQLLSELGVWSEIHRQRCCDYRHMCVWQENGHAKMHFSAQQLATSHLGSIVENRSLVTLLLEQLGYLKNVDIMQLSHIEQLEQSAQSVSVTTSTGQRIEAELLIAADGRQSSIRTLMKMPLAGGSYHQNAIVANVQTELAHQYTAWQRFLHSGPLAFLPLWDGRCSIVWSVDSEQAQSLMAMPQEDFIEALEQAFESTLGRITSCTERAAFALNWHSAEQWLQGRVLLIGDAAHGVHPLAGQGVNLGFADVSVLVDLFNAGESLYQPKRLRQFERRRKAETVTATHLFSALKSIYGRKHPIIALLRDLGMNVVDKSTLVNRMVTQRALNNLS